MATGDKKRAVMTDDIDNAQSSYPVMSLRAVDTAPDAAHTNNLISSAAVAAKASSLAAGMAIIATGNTHAAITKGQYVYIQDHATLAEGMYEATANIAANGTLSASNVTAKTEGAANALKAAIGNLHFVPVTYVSGSVTADTPFDAQASDFSPSITEKLKGFIFADLVGSSVHDPAVSYVVVTSGSNNFVRFTPSRTQNSTTLYGIAIY